MEAERLVATSPFKGKPPLEVLDLSEGWDTTAKFEIVIRRLKDLGLYHTGLVFCPGRCEEIEQLGFTKEGPPEDERHIQGGTEAYIRSPLGRNFATEMCELSDIPTLIVFKRDSLEGDNDRYYPRGNLRAAVAIVFVLVSDDF
jgi:hypothetical protein